MSASSMAERNGTPVMVLIRQHDSHPFVDRTIPLIEDVKVGRAVNKLRSSPNNAIFDCKVLSRSHAIISYQNRKFILRDTNSSNGTFVNNIRVTKEADSENAEREIFSNDFIRFGVDVFESGTNHGSIISQVKLYHPNGQEAVQKTSKVTPVEPTQQYSEQLFQLASHVNEATYREKNIERKFEELQALLRATSEVSQKSWKAMLNENHLLAKLELYENQLAIYKSDLPDEAYKSRLAEVLQEKQACENSGEEIIRRLVTEKSEALLRSDELKRHLENSQGDVSRLREELETTQDAYKKLSSHLEERMKELESVEQKLTEATGEKGALESKLQETTHECRQLQDHLNASNQEKSKLENGMAEEEEEEEREKGDKERIQARIMTLQEEAVRLKDLVGKNELLQQSLSQEADSIREDVALNDLAMLDAYLENEERSLEKVLDSARFRITDSLSDAARQLTSSTQFIRLLQTELDRLDQVRWDERRHDSASLDSTVNSEEHHVSSTGCDLTEPEGGRASVEFATAFQKARGLLTSLAEAHAKTEHGLVAHFDRLAASQSPGPPPLAAREDADGRPESCLSAKLAELDTVCRASTQMTESQQDLLPAESAPSPPMLMSTISSNFSDLAAPVSPSTTDEIQALQARLDQLQLDHRNLQEALERKVEENERYSARVQELAAKCEMLEEEKVEAAEKQRTETNSRELDVLRSDYKDLQMRMVVMEENLSLCKDDYRRVVQERDKLKQETIVPHSLGSELDAAIAPPPATANHVVTSATSLVPSRSSTDGVIPKVSAFAAITFMVFLCAVMLSVFQRFLR